MTVLVIQGMTVNFGTFCAVDRLSLEVTRGETVGVIGPNGAGKSTVIGAMCGFVPMASGSISVDGERVDRAGATRMRSLGVARTFQHPKLSGSLTVADNLLAAGRHESSWRQIVASTLRLPRQMRDEAAARKQGVDLLRSVGAGAWVNTLAEDIPHGVQRLVGVARALAGGQTKLLVLDEPAAGLDADERQVLISAINDLRDKHEFGVLLVEHDLALVLGNCQRLCVLEQGRRIAYGTSEEVQHDPVVINSYIGA